MSPAAILTLRSLLVAATVAMFALHLVSAPLLRRGVPAVTLLRWEGAYYVLLLASLIVPDFRRLLVPAIVLAVIHFSAWAYTERRPSTGPPSPGILRAVQVFDATEAVVLVWIAIAIL